jgi:hypothetical protein
LPRHAIAGDAMRTFIPFLSVPICVLPANANVTVMTNPQQWQSAVSSYNTLTFTDLPHQTVVTTQYSQLGITFTDGNDLTHVSPSFPSDGHGLHSTQATGFANITMSFVGPTYWLAFDFIGGVQIELFQSGNLIYTSNMYIADVTPFVGLISTDPFDLALAHDWTDPTVAVDNIHFGPPIPAPSALFAMCIGLLTRVSRRRR